MSDSDSPSPRPAGYSLVHLILAAVAGAVIMILLYASGVMSSVSKVASRTVGGGGSDIVSLDTVRYVQTKKIREIAAEVAKEKNKKVWQITAEDLKDTPKIKEMGMDTQQQAMTLQAALSPPPMNESEPP